MRKWGKGRGDIDHGGQKVENGLFKAHARSYNP